MSVRSNLFVAALAVLGAAAAAPASAALLTLTYTGTVSSLVDPHGVFGTLPGGGPITFTDTFVWDLDKGLNRVMPGSGYDQSIGGSVYGLESPLVSATLTINGVQVSFPGGFADQEIDAPGQYVDSDAQQQIPGPDGLKDDFVFMNSPGVPSSFYTPFSATGSGIGEFYVCAPSSCGSSAQWTFGGNLNPTSVVAVVSGGVPEPSTWAMLILGVAMVGLAARRRREDLALTA